MQSYSHGLKTRALLFQVKKWKSFKKKFFNRLGCQSMPLFGPEDSNSTNGERSISLKIAQRVSRVGLFSFMLFPSYKLNIFIEVTYPLCTSVSFSIKMGRMASILPVFWRVVRLIRDNGSRSVVLQQKPVIMITAILQWVQDFPNSSRELDPVCHRQKKCNHFINYTSMRNVDSLRLVAIHLPIRLSSALRSLRTDII